MFSANFSNICCSFAKSVFYFETSNVNFKNMENNVICPTKGCSVYVNSSLPSPTNLKIQNMQQVICFDLVVPATSNPQLLSWECSLQIF